MEKSIIIQDRWKIIWDRDQTHVMVRKEGRPQEWEFYQDWTGDPLLEHLVQLADRGLRL